MPPQNTAAIDSFAAAAHDASARNLVTGINAAATSTRLSLCWTPAVAPPNAFEPTCAARSAVSDSANCFHIVSDAEENTAK